jgi:hypothetical protein
MRTSTAYFPSEVPPSFATNWVAGRDGEFSWSATQFRTPPPTRVRRKCRHAAKPVTEPEVRADSIILNVDGSPGCAADSAVDAGRSPSPDLGSELGKSGSATTAVAPAPHGAGTYPDHEPVASGGAQRGSTLQEEAVAGSGTSATGGVAVSSMGKPATASAPKSQSPADVWGLEELIVLLYRKATIAA